jgi:hypothetical protein
MMAVEPPSSRAAVAGGFALLCLTSLACTREEPTETPTAPSRLAADTSWGTFHVTVAAEPDPIPLSKMFALTIGVYLAGDRAQAVSGTTVAVDARMPAHNHGTNLQARVARVGDGRFRAEGLLFHMPGTWELYVDVTRAAETERATFVINVD